MRKKIIIKDRSEFTEYGWLIDCIGGKKIIFSNHLKELWARKNIPL